MSSIGDFKKYAKSDPRPPSKTVSVGPWLSNIMHKVMHALCTAYARPRFREPANFEKDRFGSVVSKMLLELLVAWVPSGCPLVPPGCFLGASWVSPECPLGSQTGPRDLPQSFQIPLLCITLRIRPCMINKAGVRKCALLPYNL